MVSKFRFYVASIIPRRPVPVNLMTLKIYCPYFFKCFPSNQVIIRLIRLLRLRVSLTNQSINNGTFPKQSIISRDGFFNQSVGQQGRFRTSAEWNFPTFQLEPFCNNSAKSISKAVFSKPVHYTTHYNPCQSEAL